MPKSESPNYYMGNPNLKSVGVKQEFTKEEIAEYVKCSEDPIYFIKNYVKIVSLDEGLVPFDLWDFQESTVKTIHDNRFTICKFPRQTGKSTTTTSYLLHYILFNSNMNVAILANKLATARELLSRLKLAYEHLPHWLQQGVVEWNKGSIELENGSKVLASATSASAVRGGSFNLIFLDEFAYVPHEVADEFFSSVYPTISSGQNTKVIIVSTPKGMNLFYKFWIGATKKPGEEGKNDFVPVEVHWSDVPGRDEEWKATQIANSSDEQFRTEHECEFIGSINTLITPSKLRSMVWKTPIVKNDEGLRVFEKAEKDHLYFITVDVSRGAGIDYHAFTVIDTTEIPYKVVATFKNNELAPVLYPNIIYGVAKEYNNAYVLIEVNDIGGQVADILHGDLEYENMLCTSVKGRKGQVLGEGFGQNTVFGIRTTQPVKRIGCSTIKNIIENDKLIINDIEIIQELTSFIVKNNSYEADSGYHDDLVMCLVLFGWMTDQKYFEESFDTGVKRKLYQEQINRLEEELLPFGFIEDGIDDEVKEIDRDGSIWF